MGLFPSGTLRPHRCAVFFFTSSAIDDDAETPYTKYNDNFISDLETLNLSVDKKKERKKKGKRCVVSYYCTVEFDALLGTVEEEQPIKANQ